MAHIRRARDLSNLGRDILPANNFNPCETNELQYPTITIVSRIEDLEAMKGIRRSYDNCNEACVLSSSVETHCEKDRNWIEPKGTVIRQFFLILLEGVMQTACNVQKIFKDPFHKYFLLHTTPLLASPQIDDFSSNRRKQQTSTT
jgi:hypothetical protein